MLKLILKNSVIFVLTVFFIGEAVFLFSDFSLANTAIIDGSSTSTNTSTENTIEDLEIVIETPSEGDRIQGMIRLQARLNRPVDLLYFIFVGPEEKRFLSEQDNLQYFYDLDTRVLLNGTYYLELMAISALEQRSQQIRLEIFNEAQEEGSGSATSTSEVTEIPETQTATEISGSEDIFTSRSVLLDEISGQASSTEINDSEESEAEESAATSSEEKNEIASREEWEVKISEVPELVSGPITIRAQANFQAEKAIFVVTGPTVEEYPVKINTDGTLSFVLAPEESIVRAEYVVSLVVESAGQQISDTTIVNYVKKEYLEKEEAMEKEALGLVFMNTPKEISGEAKIIVSVNKEIEKLEFEVLGEVQKKFIGQTSQENTYYFIWPSRDFPDGLYEVNVGAIIGGQLIKKISTAIIVNNSQFEKVLEIEDEKEQASGTLPTINDEENDLPELCQERSITEREECQKFIYQQNKVRESLPQKCQEKNISSHKECEEYLSVISLPELCLEENIKEPTACRKFLLEQENTEISMPMFCQQNGVEDQEKCQQLLQMRSKQAECEIYELKPEECNEFLLDKHGKNLCEEFEIINNEECKSFLYNQYLSLFECKKDKWLCQREIKEKYLGYIAKRQTAYQGLEMISEESPEISIGELESYLGEELILPVQDSGVKFGVKKARSVIFLDEDKQLRQLAPVFLVNDRDGDGLPDDLEKRIGTDPNIVDTDNDGYDDYSELQNGYNPKGDGRFDKESLAEVDRALLENVELEQPVASGEFSQDFVVSSVEFGEGEEKVYVFQGKAEPNQVLTLYFYSDIPIVTTVVSDEFGNWQYEFENILVDGDHEVYVAINDRTGKIVKKSSPFSFFIKEARAVSASDFITQSAVSSGNEAEEIMTYYLPIAIILILLSIVLFVIYLKNYRPQNT